MTCIKKITQNIVNACKSTRGLKPRAYWANRSDCKFTFSGNVITAVDTFILGVIDGTKFSLNAGSDEVVFEDNGSVFTHKFTGIVNVQNGSVDSLDDIVVFVQSNDGQWLCYGAEQGLWKTSQAQTANDNRATVTVEMASLEGKDESYSEYFVTANLSAIPTTETKEVVSIYYKAGESIKFSSSYSTSGKIQVYNPENVKILDAATSTGFMIFISGYYRFVIDKVNIQFFKIENVIQPQDFSYGGNVIEIEDCNFTNIYTPNAASTILNTTGNASIYASIVFGSAIDAGGDIFSLELIERILYDKVSSGKLVVLDLSGSQPAIEDWTANAVTYKDALVNTGSTVLYNEAP